MLHYSIFNVRQFFKKKVHPDEIQGVQKNFIRNDFTESFTP